MGYSVVVMVVVAPAAVVVVVCVCVCVRERECVQVCDTLNNKQAICKYLLRFTV